MGKPWATLMETALQLSDACGYFQTIKELVCFGIGRASTLNLLA